MSLIKVLKMLLSKQIRKVLKYKTHYKHQRLILLQKVIETMNDDNL